MRRTAEEIVAAIHGSYHTGSKHGLENTHLLLAEMNVSPSAVPMIHIAGTNGKGSVCAMLERILRQAGYRTGLYTSPFLQAYQERIRLDGVPIDDERMIRYGERLLDAAARLNGRGVYPTPFELGTALALAAFAGERVDAAVIEVGLGGRLDPTNVITPVLCGITAIGLDHMEYLGGTLPEIAAEKAGIMKLGVPVVCHPAEPEVAEVLAGRAAAVGAPLTQLGAAQISGAACTARGSTASFHLAGDWPDMTLSLPGAHQLTNALTVLGLVEALQTRGFRLPEDAVRRGMAETVWPARLEWCGSVLIDGAHNPQGMAALARFVRTHLPDRRRVLLSGVLADKLQPSMLDSLREISATAVTVTPDNPRALDAAAYADRLRAAGVDASPAETLEEGLKRARALAGEDGIVVAAGSLYFAGALRTALELPWR